MDTDVETVPGTKLDYEEINLPRPPIGCWSFGIVYSGEWRTVDVAVKVMKTDLIGLAEMLPSFTQDVSIMEHIPCPYIVNFIRSVSTPDTLCLVTNYCASGRCGNS